MNKTMIYLIMAVLAVFGNYNFVQADDEDFRFEAGLLEDSYLSYEPAVLDLTVTNFSEDTLRVQTLSVHSGNVLVILVDQGGDTLKPTESREVIRGPGVLLQPRETYYSNINLNDLYGGGMLHKRLPIGRYKVQAFYSQRSSPILSFEVKEPEESEKEAYELLTTGYNYQLAREPDQAITSFQDIITRFPNSDYVELAYFDLARSYIFYSGDVNKSDSLKATLLDKFPNSYFSRLVISSLVEDRNPDERREFLNKIIKEHAGSRSAKFAEQMLKGW